MVTIVIPEKIEKAVKGSEDAEVRRQKEYCQNLLTGVDEEILKAYEKIRPVEKEEPVAVATPAAPVNSLLDSVKQAFKNEISRRNDSYLGKPGYNPADFGPMQHKPDIGIKDAEGQWIHTTNSFAILLNNISVVEEGSYMGHDKNDIKIVRARIPEGYVGHVGYVYKKHIPQFAYDRRLITPMRFISQKRASVYLDLCQELKPLQTNQEFHGVPKEEVSEVYGWISMKIKKSDNTLMGWVPGVDIKSHEPTTDDDRWCLLGAHYKNNGVVSKRK
jgi:hypothetical protein